MATPTQDILGGLGELIEEIAGTPAADIRPEMRLADDLEIDSLAMVEVAAATEEKFGIRISDEDAKGLATVQDVVDAIARLSQPA
jgi:acyl carrier protein